MIPETRLGPGADQTTAGKASLLTWELQPRPSHLAQVREAKMAA